MNEVRDFYSFYSLRFGKFSDYIFSLFWQGKYRECVELYQIPLKLFSGDVTCLGMNDALIYNHCCFLNGRDILSSLNFPKPPNKNQVLYLYDYEVSEEKKCSSISENILTQPTILHKAILAARAGILTGCEEAIETGTNLGMSSYLFSGPFEYVETIEADKNFYSSSANWLKYKSSHIGCYHGNSAVHLKKILLTKTSKQLIFLDAHYSSGITSNEFGECPLLDELVVIFESQVNCTIVIDDIRLMGSNGWPDLKGILNLIPRQRNVVIEYDQMIIS